ncbi:MAG TPA: GNAT family N-acetyltransferase [Bryobacteraceae bacterium]|nr:GNAT family N-acetyltransferase [Bryobacteraceae bacterium]
METRRDENTTVVRATAQNAADALVLIEEYYEAANVMARDSRATLMEILSDPNCAVWVAYNGHQSVGCILYKPLPQRPLSGEMKRLYVRPEYRGKGVAPLLLKTVEEFSRSRGNHWLYLDTKDDLTAAQRFYKRHGYQPCERYNDNPQATIFMRKALSRN